MISLRPEVQAFAECMETALRKHDATKGPVGWKGCNPARLYSMMRDELVEVNNAILTGAPKEEIAREAVDVANFAMMIVDVLVGCRPEPAPMSLAAWCVEANRLAASKGFTQNMKPENIPRALCLIHGEISEALEELRKNADPLHTYTENGKPEGFAVELADVFLRLANLCGGLGIDLEEAVALKHEFNKTRPPKHGKLF